MICLTQSDQQFVKYYQLPTAQHNALNFTANINVGIPTITMIDHYQSVAQNWIARLFLSGIFSENGHRYINQFRKTYPMLYSYKAKSLIEL